MSPSSCPRRLCRQLVIILSSAALDVWLASDEQPGEARHWAIVASLVATAKLDGVEPLVWLTDVLERMVSGWTKAHELARLLPWNWKAERLAAAVDA